MIIVYYGRDIEKRDTIVKTLQSLSYDFIEVGDSAGDMLMKEIQTSTGDLNGTSNLFMYYKSETHETVKNVESHLGFTVIRKAMENELNQNWKLKDLMAEINEEAEYFIVREKLYDLVQKADMQRMEKDDEYAQLLAASYGLIEQEDAPKELLEFAIELIEKKAPKSLGVFFCIFLISICIFYINCQYFLDFH